VNISELNDWLLSKDKDPLIMGILNVTPDSFTDGGKFLDSNTAVNHAMDMIADGADIIDIGGESTRPFSDPVSEREELSRVISVIKKLREKTDTVISIDTTKSSVADNACNIGADIVNDISGFSLDLEMPNIVADYDVPVILMHMKGNPKNMQDNPHYNDIIEEINIYFSEKISIAKAAKIKPEKIILDPGIGFGKNIEHNFIILQKLNQFRVHGYPIMIGTSRKSFIGLTLDLPPDDRLEGTAATVSIGIMNGARIVRVHDVKEINRVVTVVEKIRQAI